MSTDSQERRDFSRIPFQAEAHVQAADGNRLMHCQVIDISLNGVLVEKSPNWHPTHDAPYEIELLLNHGSVIIQMQARVAHISEKSVGFACKFIDVDSITHLKRLVELNLGDESLLHRELSALIERH